MNNLQISDVFTLEMLEEHIPTPILTCDTSLKTIIIILQVWVSYSANTQWGKADLTNMRRKRVAYCNWKTRLLFIVKGKITSNNKKIGSAFEVTRLSLFCQVGDDVIRPCKICAMMPDTRPKIHSFNWRCPIQSRLQSVCVCSFYDERNKVY